jgi:hypothetical protein
MWQRKQEEKKGRDDCEKRYSQRTAIPANPRYPALRDDLGAHQV